MAKIYLTARWVRSPEMRAARIDLKRAGHEVTSRWLDEADGTPADIAAMIDLDDLDNSDTVLVFSESPDIGYYTGGRHVELGYAICAGLRIIVVGPRENVFYHKRGIEQVETLEAAIQLLAKATP